MLPLFCSCFLRPAFANVNVQCKMRMPRTKTPTAKNVNIRIRRIKSCDLAKVPAARLAVCGVRSRLTDDRLIDDYIFIPESGTPRSMSRTRLRKRTQYAKIWTSFDTWERLIAPVELRIKVCYLFGYLIYIFLCTFKYPLNQ